jgi:hypothetical protein
MKTAAAVLPIPKHFLLLCLQVAMTLLVFLIVMSFSVVAPIVPVAGVVFMCASW